MKDRTELAARFRACAAENIVVTQRGYLANLLLAIVVALVSTTISSTAEAGPLLDWLFQRNRSQGINGTGGCFGNSCLFGNQGRGYAASRYGARTGANPASAYGNQANNPANAFAAANPAATTAGYAPQGGGCSSGWCQETVVRYVPQIAYRTMYQPVPVTTYKTSTSINPQTGLPRTCTRPCTSYNYQARRVPYTTYRPVYTTVPVADTWGSGPQQPVAAGYPPQQQPGYSNAYAYQPPNSGGCTSCQNNGTGYQNSGYPGYTAQGSGFSNWSTAPGYTPGNALLPPAPATAGAPPSGWQGYGYDAAPRATPWRNESSGGSTSQWRGETSNSYSDSRSGYSATPWQADNGDRTQPPVYGTPADERPRLNNRPLYPDEFGLSPLKPRPISEEMRQRLNGQKNRSESSSSYLNRDRDDFAFNRQPPSDMFRTPNEQGYAAPPLIQPPANRLDAPAPASFDEYYRGGIRQRTPQGGDFSSPRDKTARSQPQRSKLERRGEMPLIEETSRTRYAAAPIRWPSDTRPSERRSSYQTPDRNDGWGVVSNRNRVESDWAPVR